MEVEEFVVIFFQSLRPELEIPTMDSLSFKRVSRSEYALMVKGKKMKIWKRRRKEAADMFTLLAFFGLYEF